MAPNSLTVSMLQYAVEVGFKAPTSAGVALDVLASQGHWSTDGRSEQ